jgi:hypothetical protein
MSEDPGNGAESSATSNDDLRTPFQTVLNWLSKGRLGHAQWHPEVAEGLSTPWRDTPAYGRPQWRERAAYLGEEEVFAVDYIVCARCSTGWVEAPYTHDDYTRCGLATAGLAAIRSDYPQFTWHTAGGHFRDSEAFWSANGHDVPGAYEQRPRCAHLSGL